MSDSSGQNDAWFVGEDGSLSVDEDIENVVFHPSLNVILVTTKSKKVHVLDVTSGAIFHSSNLSVDKSSSIRCTYMSSLDRVVFASDFAVGARRDLNGMLLLESALQLPVSKQDDILCVELPLPEAIHLNQSLLGADLPGVDHVMDVMRMLDKEICVAQEATKHNHKLAKWSTVCLMMSHSVLKSVFSGLLTELKRLQQKVPAVPVVSALLDRLGYLLVSGQSELASMVNGVNVGTADRTLMYSESARLDTFAKWPHLNYKWALPEPMAQAGFYYQPSSVGDDRAMCFTCNVCLVCWEPTDEPWSEHERHSPQCPFVKGEFTQNVPVSVTYATEPAQRHCDQNQKIECVSTSTSSHFFATSTLSGNIVVWDTSRQLKKHMKFAVDLHNPVISSAIGNVNSSAILKSAAGAFHGLQGQDLASSECAASNQVNGSSSSAASSSLYLSESPVPSNGETSVSATGTDISTSAFMVTALSVIAGSNVDPGVMSMFRASQSISDVCPSLVVGVFARVNSASRGCSSLTSSLPAWKSDGSQFSEVQVLNQLNQAISGEAVPVIHSPAAVSNQNESVTSVENSEVPPHRYIPCLVLYDILAAVPSNGNKRELKNDPVTFQGTQVTKMEMNDGWSPVVDSMKDADMSDDDPDVQIIGVSGPLSPSVPKIINLTNESLHGSSYGIIGGSAYGVIGGKDIQLKESKAKETEIGGSSSQNRSFSTARNVVQCLTLPPDFVDSAQFVQCVIPVLDKSHVIVVTSPVSSRDNLSSFSRDVPVSSKECRSCVLIYQVMVESDATVLNPVPAAVLPFTGLDNAVVSATLLPQEVCFLNEDDEDEPPSDSLFGDRTEGLRGALALTTYLGDIKILSLSDLSVLVVIKATSQEAYISTTYCTSIDRLCACTREGKLRFFSVGPKQRHLDELDGGLSFGGLLTDEADSLNCDSMPGDDHKANKRNNLLVNEPLTVEVLTTLHDLIQFENLLPRFSATVPPCWNEIQQEQQQRKHPQHLHQQGEATQHTRTWRLQTDSTSWDEHLFEIVLPRHICIGHVDLKFTLNSICTAVPNIQVTLLKQSLSSIGRSVLTGDSFSKPSSADAKIDFSLPTSFSSETGSRAGTSGLEEEVSGWSDLSSEFLERHRSDIVCGPLELSNYVDLSGTQGIVPLTSSQLLKCRSKSLLLHIKSRTSRDRMPVRSSKIPSKTAEATKSKPTPSLGKPLNSTFGQGSSERTTIGISSNKQKVENIKGCDWLQELSITVRRFRKSGQHHKGAIRCVMLQSVDFHMRLLLAACGQDDISSVGGSSSKEHRQHLALDVLTWIMAIQMNDASKMQMQGSSLMQTLQPNLLAIVQSCLLEGDRSIAHKCAKLIAFSLEYVKNCTDPDVAPAFNYALLQALLECLPRTLTSYSAGALHWYFTLLNHVKCMDASATGEKCIEMLGEIAKSYSCRVNPYHSTLRARYGLYGMPLEPDIFDIDPPPLRTSPVTNSTYAGVVTNTAGTTAGGISASGIPLSTGTGVGGIASNNGMTGNLGFSDDFLFKDLMNLCHLEKGVSGSSTGLGISSGSRDGSDLPLSRYLTGLLEVEPLHFTCHSTSDGTRMERMDALNQANTLPGNPVSLSGTINFAEGLSSATGTMLSSLSSAMVSAEQQLIQLQQKQLQLIKLQQQKQKLEQKLAETTKNVATLPSHFFPYGSELFPPTPKNTPFFMTPPVTPPNESYHGILVTGFSNDKDADKPPTGKAANSAKASSEKNDPNKQLSMLWPHTQTLFQPPPAQALVIERMHSGARRFVVLDFGKAILLTDVVIPMCGDLASLSIDIWIQGEESDGHRLVVSSDIGISSLIMNDIMPPPVCRYLKITTIRRYGGNSTRSKIPIGSFYGHTFMLPWETVATTTHSTPHRSNTSPEPSAEHERMIGQSSYDQSQILSQLSMYMSLLEDVQCRYSLACKNLITLLSAAGVPGTENNNTQFFLKKGRRTDDDNKIYMAYCECIQLQVQLNLVKHASSRLQKVLGIYNFPPMAFDQAQGNLQLMLKQTCVDKLRVLIEFLLDTLLSMTNSCPTIPQMPISLCMTLTPSYAEMLFRNLCIHGTKKMQTHAGVILVRVCGTQSWWGEFLGNVLQEFFSAEQQTIFPQDRVFILLAALGQKSLTGPAASSILENILLLLARQLYPLTSNSRELQNSSLRVLDLTLIGWLLLFLSKCLDCCQPNTSDDIDKSSGKDREGRLCFTGSVSNRWNFIQGENAVQTNKLSKTSSSKLYRRKLQKRLLHHKQQLLNLQQAKKHFSTKLEESIASGNLLDKETEHLVKTQDLLFKKQMRQYSSKHLKDIINIRRTDGEFLRKQNLKEGSGSHNGEKDSYDCDPDSSLLVMSREKCIPVVHGLVMLLLSMDFTCHVDLFIVACKVLARVIVSTRPTISLSEAMSQDDLERLMLLMCNIEYNHGNVSWGGSWASHSITCLLKDILEGERLYAMNLDTSVDSEVQIPAGATAASADTSVSEVEESPLCNGTLPVMDDDQPANDSSAKAKYDVDMSMLVDALMEEELYDDQMNAKFTDLKDLLYSDAVKFMNVTMKSNPNSSTVHWGISGNPVFSEEDKKDLKLWKLKNATFNRHTNTAPQGVSLAMDSRLEQGVELRAELRLKLMLTMEANNIQNAMNSSLPLLTFGAVPKAPQGMSLPDEWLMEDGFVATSAHTEPSSSLTMLSTCFNNLFSQLHLRRINLNILLQTWLTLNDDTSSEDGGCQAFDPCRIPTVTSDPHAVSSLLSALASSSSVAARTWILAFETLTLMANIRYSTDRGVAVGGAAEPAGAGASQFPDKWLASFIITDNNLMAVLIKFLSSSGQQTSVVPIVQNNHIGPVVVLAFHEFLARLLRRCGDEDSQRLKEVLLRLVLSLSADGGAFHLFLGPLDAQYRLVEDICELNLETVDVNTAMSILESVAALVHRHIMSQEHVLCRSTIENSVSARSVYVGLFSTMLRNSENKSLTADATQDLLMCSLLKLASLLVKVPLPGRPTSKKTCVVNPEAELSVDIRVVREGMDVDNSQTDFSKINQAVGASGSMTVSLPEDGVTDEEKTETARSVTSTSASSSGALTAAQGRKFKKCSHFVYTGTSETPDPKPATLTDIVLGHRQIMLHLMEALGSCNTNTVAMIFASSGLHSGCKQETAVSENPLSVGDGIFNILLTLNSLTSKLSNVVKPIYEYLSSELQGFGSSVRVSRLSEPLLWFVLRVLDCHDAIGSFLQMGGIEVICHNLVSTNRHIIDTSPSLVSAIMQYFGTAKLSNGNARRGLGGLDAADSLQNFAPLGTITSSSPTASPADILIHGTTPHRRARSAAWTYHYYPHEAWVDLNITLPCAVLLKEVNIQPHLTSLATCPAAITVEGSRDGTHTVPICPPTCTSGLTTIRIQLLKEEVITAVTIRLHKPRDSHTVGLAQITLMGHMAFGDSGMARASNILTPPEDYVSRTSIGWLRLLHHCVTQCEDLQKEVTEAAVSTPDLLVTCTTLLMTSSAVIYANSIESVLLTIGLHSTEMGLGLLDQLLRNPSLGRVDDGQSAPSFYNKLNGRANESTIDILYQLGTHQDAGLMVRLKALTSWLGDCARSAIQRCHSASDDLLHRQGVHHPTPVSLASPAVIHVHCIATILWNNNERAVTDDLKRIVTKDLLSAMYEWSTTASDTLLKQAVDSVICSLCFIHPHFFSLLLEWMGVIIYRGMESFTDDHKDIQHHLGPLTDDLKADTEAARGITESRMSDLDYPPCILPDINHMMLEELHLFTLARACQSPAALRQLLNSGFVLALCHGLFEVSSREMRQHDEPMIILSDVSTDAVKMAMDGGAGANSHGSAKPRMFVNRQGSLSDISSQPGASSIVMTADAVAPVLCFLTELSNEVMMKDWLGGSDGRIFWSVLLKSLCASSSYVLVRPSHRAMTNEQRGAIETATICFFSKVISCHAENQLQFSLVLHDVIQSYNSGSRGCPTPLPGFLRRLFLQVLLEDEKVLVCIGSHSQMYKGIHGGLPLAIQHPRFGVGHKHRTLVVSLQATCGEILSKISEAQSLVSSQVLEDQEKVAEEIKKDASELGIEVIDQISAIAGLKAKEKREKDVLSSGQRSSVRLGGRNGDRSASSTQIAVLALYHSFLSDQPIPSELSMSQLLTVLYEHGVAPGQTYINLTMKLAPQHKDGMTSEKTAGQSGLESIPEEVIQDELENSISNSMLLQAQNFTSALQVFSSIGGLALLAEHLPLLYPEFSRQATPAEVSKETAVPGSIGHDWVTVESAEDIYEEIYEPTMPPSPPVQHKPTSIAPAQVQSIPPHSLVAFGLFLRLPGYAEVLLKDKRKAQCLLRLVLGVTDDGEGGHILTSAIASSLPSLPFNVLKSLFDSMPLTTDDGVMLRRMTLEIGAIHLILACLSVLGHHAPRQQIPGFYQDIIKAAMQTTQTVSTNTSQQKNTTEEKSQNYWAKGTGFGTGSTTSSWDAEHALLRQKSEEEHVTCLLQVLASYINPGGIVAKSFIAAELVEETEGNRTSAESSPLPSLLPELLSQSCLVPALSSYLRNDSVLDMACHVPLYRALLELLRAMAVCPLLVPLLLPLDKDDDSAVSVSSLLDKMKQCVDTYASRLKGNRMKSKSMSKSDDDESEGLALLIPDIQKTAQIVNSAVEKVSEKLDLDASNRKSCELSLALIGRMNHSEEERYIAIIKQLQFDTFKMVSDDNNIVQFVVPHHYESNVKAAGDINNAARARRLAQEAVTLSTSLPLSASSSVFVRCDEERLDVMKVMMTGPADTPYANGCFEFDVYFPTDYPNSPPLINLETTGNHTIRFNPNLYNDGKVCLSILNTWHGRPEEKWNSQTSSFLQVLVSIQSLILVSEPYFNEPGYERSRGTPSGTASSREYDANIRQATVKWAMLEMLRNPPASFKSVIQWHFWLKRNEIISQIEEWINDLDSYSNDKRVGRSIAHSSVALKRHYSQLKEELTKLRPPSDPAFPSELTTPSEERNSTPTPQASSEYDINPLQTEPNDNT